MRPVAAIPYLSFTRDSELGQQIAPEITVSLLEASGSVTPLDVLAHDRRAPRIGDLQRGQA